MKKYIHIVVLLELNIKSYQKQFFFMEKGFLIWTRTFWNFLIVFLVLNQYYLKIKFKKSKYE